MIKIINLSLVENDEPNIRSWLADLKTQSKYQWSFLPSIIMLESRISAHTCLNISIVD
jgi:hypothetical protein